MPTKPPHHAPFIPPDQWYGLLQRLALVWGVALVIAVLNYTQSSSGASFGVSLVYSYAISTSIWLFTDVGRFVFRRQLKAVAPYYWPPALQASGLMIFSTLCGYALGTWVGDWYAGQSTWDLWQQNRPRFTGLLITSVAISAAYVAYFFQRSRAEHQKRQATQAQLMLLQSQLEPHMLFNVLANLRALIGIDPARAQAMLDHLDGYLRSTLMASRTPDSQHTLAQEIARIEDYLALMAIRMGPRLRYQFNVPPELMGCQVPPMLLQPLVENCIRHGLEPKIEGGEIRISALITDGQLVIRIEDTGLGLSPHAKGKGQGQPKGFGLTQVRQRLQALFGADASLDIGNLQDLGSPGEPSSPADSGTLATVRLPLSPAFAPE